MKTSNYKTMSSVSEWHNKRVLVRVDFNVPQEADGTISDDTRMQETLPTLRTLLQAGARVVVASHLGRPKGQVVPSMSLRPIAEHLKTLLPGVKINAASEVVSPAVTAAVEALKPGELVVLENLRFEPGEEKNDPELAKQLAALADIYVNDAFGAAHRAHASTEGVAHLVPVAVAGLLMAKELDALGGLLENPERPFTAIVGGSKISSKLSVLEQLLGKVDTLIIGGGMAYTFLLAQGYSVGNSIVEPDYVPKAKAILEESASKGVTIVLSEDLLVGDKFSADATIKQVDISAIPEGFEGLDVGEKTRAAMRSAILASKTILWNGPVGVFEMKPFEGGTRAIAEAVAEATAKCAKSILGGGDTVAAIEQFGYEKTAFTHVSTGGGASLEFLEGKVLPGVAALESKVVATV